MKIKVLKSFNFDLEEHVDFIARDKLGAAKNFEKDVLALLKDLSKYPYLNRRSIYYQNENIRDLIF